MRTLIENNNNKLVLLKKFLFNYKINIDVINYNIY